MEVRRLRQRSLFVVDFFRVNSKISQDIKTPFKLDGITRVDDTPVHKAVREALVNCLVNADFYLPQGIVIKKNVNSLVIENPGSIRIGKKQMLLGGVSNPRNKNFITLIGPDYRLISGQNKRRKQAKKTSEKERRLIYSYQEIFEGTWIIKNQRYCCCN